MWDRQYECNLVPPLDRWFNLKSELYEPHIERKEDQCVQWTVDQSQASEESSEQPLDWSNYLRERYWAGHRPMITCGREVAQRSNWELALHLRLGDLIAPVIGAQP